MKLARLLPNRIQFKFSTMLLIVAASAVGLSTLRQSPRLIADVLYWTLAVCVCAMLSRQSWLIRQSILELPGEAPIEMRTGAWLQIIWRMLIVAMVVVIYVIQYALIPSKLVSVPDHNLGFLDVGHSLEQSLFVPMFLVCLFVALSPRQVRSRPNDNRSMLIDSLAWALAAVLSLLLWADTGSLHSLVLIAVRGVENAWPLHWLGASVVQSNRDGLEYWPGFAGFSVLSSAISLVCLWRLVADKHTRCYFAATTILCAASTAVSIAHAVWIVTDGLSPLSGSHLQAIHGTSATILITAAILVLMLATAFTLSALSHAQSLRIFTQRLPIETIHIPGSIALLAIAGSVVWLAEVMVPLPESIPGISDFWSEFVHRLTIATSLLVIAILLCALQAMFPPRGVMHPVIIAVHPARFAQIWTVTVVTVSCASIAIASWSVAIWQSRWFQESSFTTWWQAIFGG
jgi:hypothetical protein